MPGSPCSARASSRPPESETGVRRVARCTEGRADEQQPAGASAKAVRQAEGHVRGLEHVLPDRGGTVGLPEPLRYLLGRPQVPPDARGPLARLRAPRPPRLAAPSRRRAGAAARRWEPLRGGPGRVHDCRPPGPPGVAGEAGGPLAAGRRQRSSQELGTGWDHIEVGAGKLPDAGAGSVSCRCYPDRLRPERPCIQLCLPDSRRPGRSRP
mmetsp:Transcript_93955/g.265894  ORF Transcript_93955/g.265894 Transcript_93955/m.265894 type:complete len:210 (-) Transcript_93955:1085-1714(-)